MGRVLRGVTALDVAIAAAVTATLELEVWTESLEPTAAAVAGLGVVGMSLAFRRVAPLATLAVGLAALLATVLAGVSLEKPVAPLFFFVLALYSVGLREEVGRAVAGLLFALVLTPATVVVSARNGSGFDWTDVPFLILVVATPWFVGRAMRGRLHESAELRNRAERVERERLEAVAEERRGSRASSTTWSRTRSPSWSSRPAPPRRCCGSTPSARASRCARCRRRVGRRSSR
jgi:hypothetical protein